MKNNLKNKKAFTLIELLVVIAIISLLASVILASLSSARDKARGAKIVTEMNELKNAFELYKSEFGEYPGEGVPLIRGLDCGWWAGLETFLQSNLVANNFIPSVPQIGSIRNDWGCTPSIYATGDDANLYSLTWDWYPTCGGNKLNGYIFLIYSDLDLNFTKPGIIQGGTTYYPYEPWMSAETTNWYCIGA